MRVKPRYAIATHERFERSTTLRELSDRLGEKVVAHEDSPLECYIKVTDQQRLKLEGTSLKILHTQDSICVHDGRNIFTGDTLFDGTNGRFERADTHARLSCIRAMTTGTSRPVRKVRRIPS